VTPAADAEQASPRLITPYLELDKDVKGYMWIRNNGTGELADSSMKSVSSSTIFSCCLVPEIRVVQGSHVEKIASIAVGLL
jgi:hypothetical protein